MDDTKHPTSYNVLEMPTSTCQEGSLVRLNEMAAGLVTASKIARTSAVARAILTTPRNIV